MSSLTYRSITRDEFLATPRGQGDKFARTFSAKADAFDLWSPAMGAFIEDELVSAIVVKVATVAPVANLVLLHTFAKHRRKGYARVLTLLAYEQVSSQVQFFRVSSEPDAVAFYRALGFRFWGEQASGTLLSVHRVRGLMPSIGDYADPAIQTILARPGRGSLVKRYDQPL